jgi:hypothetical protein
MTITETKSDNEVAYEAHIASAEELLGQAEVTEPGELFNSYVALAQVYATLAQAYALRSMVDSYNGWKDLGK